MVKTKDTAPDIATVTGYGMMLVIAFRNNDTAKARRIALRWPEAHRQYLHVFATWILRVLDMEPAP